MEHATVTCRVKDIETGDVFPSHDGMWHVIRGVMVDFDEERSGDPEKWDYTFHVQKQTSLSHEVGASYFSGPHKGEHNMMVLAT